MTMPAPSPWRTRPPETSTRGPKILLAVGVALLALAVAVYTVGAAVGGGSVTSVIEPDGVEGPDVVGAVDLPGSGTVALEPGTYAVHLVGPGADVGEERIEHAADDVRSTLTVTGPDGSDRPVVASWMGSSVEMVEESGTTRVIAIAAGQFEVTSAGEHVLAAGVPGTTDGSPARLLVVRDPGEAAFIRGLAVGIGLHLVGSVLGLAGMGVTIGGGVWLASRRRSVGGPS